MPGLVEPERLGALHIGVARAAGQRLHHPVVQHRPRVVVALVVVRRHDLVADGRHPVELLRHAARVDGRHVVLFVGRLELGFLSGAVAGGRR